MMLHTTVCGGQINPLNLLKSAQSEWYEMRSRSLFHLFPALSFFLYVEDVSGKGRVEKEPIVLWALKEEEEEEEEDGKDTHSNTDRTVLY